VGILRLVFVSALGLFVLGLRSTREEIPGVEEKKAVIEDLFFL
jgi:hypothetical protein